MRLIDADALMQTLGITDMDCDKCGWGKHGFCTRGSDFTDACTAIEDAPTIEERMEKGYWIKQPYKSDKYVIFRCSECLTESGFGYIESKWANFCPNCGADMRGGENETKGSR